MIPEPIYNLKKRDRMRVACFMSGSGTNAIKIIEHSLKSARFQVVLIFTDVKDGRYDKRGEKMCNAKDIAKEFGVAYECVDIRDFYCDRGHKTRRDLSLRPEFDSLVLEKIVPYEIDVIALAGYMSITTEPILSFYEGRILNVHPADLSIMDGSSRKYVGMHAVKDAILEGEKVLRSSTHVVRERVDYGEILVISESVPVFLPECVTVEVLKRDKELLKTVVKEHQNRLKGKGDWVIYPLTLDMIAEGRFALDSKGNVFLDGYILSKGFRL